MDIDFCGFDHVHLLGESATLLASTVLAAPCGVANPRDTAPSIAAVCALPGLAVAALASAFNYGF